MMFDVMQDAITEMVSKNVGIAVMIQMIETGDFVPYIGFYKECREKGINLHPKNIGRLQSLKQSCSNY